MDYIEFLHGSIWEAGKNDIFLIIIGTNSQLDFYLNIYERYGSRFGLSGSDFNDESEFRLDFWIIELNLVLTSNSRLRHFWFQIYAKFSSSIHTIRNLCSELHIGRTFEIYVRSHSSVRFRNSQVRSTIRPKFWLNVEFWHR